MNESEKEVVQTITISRYKNGLWFATSEDEPTIFVSAYGRESLMVVLAYALSPRMFKIGLFQRMKNKIESIFKRLKK
jgi:hypothetical protein